MTAILLLALLQVGVPLVGLAWVGFGRPHSRLSWGLVSASCAAWLIAGRLAGLWLFPPPWVPLTLLVLLAGAITWNRSSLEGLSWRPRSAAAWVETIVAVLLFVIAGLWTAESLVGRQPPDVMAVDLRFPLRDGTYHLVSAGSTQRINPHVATLSDPRFSAWRGQSYAADIVKLNVLGLRAFGVAPADPEKYVIFGDDVYAPCTGTVAQVADGIEDMRVGKRDRSHMAGNHVLIDCDGFQVLLGHLRRGSVQVEAGDPLDPSDVVGRVGNSGNTDEPHLHVHAQRASTDPRNPVGGDPLPMTFDGQFPNRNDMITRTPNAPANLAAGWTPTIMTYAQIVSCLVALVMLLASLWTPRLGRLLFVVLFAWAAQVNLRTAVDQPEVYLDYAPLAALSLYRDFILGFFARHVTLLVGLVATAQACIAVFLLLRPPFPALALTGALIFLLAIAPLGVGSGFPATVIMALAAMVLLRQPWHSPVRVTDGAKSLVGVRNISRTTAAPRKSSAESALRT